jgi:hypothetical protein
MTDHPITPPPELVQQWVAEIWHEGTPVRVALSDEHIATQAARWGADQELEACCEWVEKTIPSWVPNTLKTQLRAARRPKPKSLKEQALETLKYPKDFWSEAEVDTIRLALEALPND